MWDSSFTWALVMWERLWLGEVVVVVDGGSGGRFGVFLVEQRGELEVFGWSI